MANKKRQQTIAKRNRERAVEEKRTLKRLAKQEKREALRNGEPAEHDGGLVESDGGLVESDGALVESDGVDQPDPPTRPDLPRLTWIRCSGRATRQASSRARSFIGPRPSGDELFTLTSGGSAARTSVRAR